MKEKKIKWIDKKSSMMFQKRVIKAGDIVPAGILSEKRIEHLREQGKIRIEGDPIEKEESSAEKIDKIFEKPAEVSQEEEKKEEKEKKPVRRGRPRSGPKNKQESDENDNSSEG